jgi:hypothetical protein
MNRIKAFGAFWYDFVIGDDWRVAALVVAGLALTAILTHVAGVNAWWLLPVFVFAALAWSLHRATTSKSLSRTAASLTTEPVSAPHHSFLLAETSRVTDRRSSPAPGFPPSFPAG